MSATNCQTLSTPISAAGVSGDSPDGAGGGALLAEPGTLEIVPIDSITPAPENDCLYDRFSGCDLDDNSLYESIRDHGILEPITVSSDGVILSGHRRYNGAIFAKLDHVHIRRTNVVFNALSKEARVKLLAAYNYATRSKSVEEQAREELVSVYTKDIFKELRERLAEKEQAHYRPVGCDGKIDFGVSTKRAVISAAKQGFLKAVNAVLDEWQYYWPLSVRQVHYQLLNAPPLCHSGKKNSRYKNNRQSYRALIDLVARGRLAGKIHWKAIADETRPVSLWRCYAGAREYIHAEAKGMLGYYRRDLMQSQPRHVEIVCEKNTVAETVKSVALKYCIPVTSGRGYCSLEPRRQIAERVEASGKRTLTLIVISDCDPDGDEIAASLARSMQDDFDVSVEAVRGALTHEQARSYGLKENFDAKPKSSQYKKFVNRHGSASAYELEALPQGELEKLVEQAIRSVIDMAAYDREVDLWGQEAPQIEAVRQRAISAVLGKAGVELVHDSIRGGIAL
jgi:hypothetical protein